MLSPSKGTRRANKKYWKIFGQGPFSGLSQHTNDYNKLQDKAKGEKTRF